MMQHHPVPVSETWIKAADVCNAVGLALMIAFAATVTLCSGGAIKETTAGSAGGRAMLLVLLDEEWMDKGFCIAHQDVPYRSSLDWCLYLDTLFAIIFGGAVCLVGAKSRPWRRPTDTSSFTFWAHWDTDSPTARVEPN